MTSVGNKPPDRQGKRGLGESVVPGPQESQTALISMKYVFISVIKQHIVYRFLTTDVKCKWTCCLLLLMTADRCLSADNGWLLSLVKVALKILFFCRCSEEPAVLWRHNDQELWRQFTCGLILTLNQSGKQVQVKTLLIMIIIIIAIVIVNSSSSSSSNNNNDNSSNNNYYYK